MIGLTVPEGLPHFEIRAALDGSDFLLRFEWNQRAEKWYLSVSDQDGSPITGAIKVVADWPVLRLVQDSRKPRGVLFCMDRSGQGLDPHLADLGARCPIVYIPADEL